MSISKIFIFATLLALNQSSNLTFPTLIDESEIIDEVNKVLDCVEYIAENGIEEENIERFKPVTLTINNFDISKIDENLLKGHLTLEDEFYGTYGWQLKKLHFASLLPNLKVEFDIALKKFHIKGDYDVDITFLDIENTKGNGHIASTTTDTSFSGFITITTDLTQEKLSDISSIDDIIASIKDIDLDVGVHTNIFDFKITGLPNEDEVNEYIIRYLNNILAEYKEDVNEILNDNIDKLLVWFKTSIQNFHSTDGAINAIIKHCIVKN